MKTKEVREMSIADLQDRIAGMKAEGIYPEKLW